MFRWSWISHPARACLITFLAFCAVASLPARASVVYTSRNSSLSAVVCNSGNADCNTQVTDTSFDSFSQSVGVSGSTGFASQQSQLSQSGISVNMLANQAGFTGYASSELSVSFSVDAPTSYTLSGSNAGSGAGGITFSAPCENPPFFGYTPPCTSTQQTGSYYRFTISQAGVLQPGAYTLFVDAIANGPEYFGTPPSSSSTADLAFAPVPLPPTSLLFATGLAALLLRRHRV